MIDAIRRALARFFAPAAPADQPYTAGYLSQRSREPNPHEPGTREHAAWERGRSQAWADDQW